jgi:hypothetical protein
VHHEVLDAVGTVQDTATKNMSVKENKQQLKKALRALLDLLRDVEVSNEVPKSLHSEAATLRWYLDKIDLTSERAPIDTMVSTIGMFKDVVSSSGSRRKRKDVQGCPRRWFAAADSS